MAHGRADQGEDEEGVFERRAPRGAKAKAAPKVKVEKPPRRNDPERTHAPMVQVMTPEGPMDKVSKAGAEKLERAEQLLQAVFVEALGTCQDTLSTFDTDLEVDENGDDVIPDHWAAELGGDKIAVARRLRIAKAARLPPKLAPIALVTAQAVVQNVVRMHAKQQNIMNVKKLNVAVIVGGTKHEYPSIDVTNGGRDDD